MPDKEQGRRLEAEEEPVNMPDTRTSDKLSAGEKVEDLPDTKPSRELPMSDRQYERVKTRAANIMGYLIVGGFVVCTGATVLTGLWYRRFGANAACEMLKTVATTFGTPLGFVFGFYYGVARR